MLTLLNRYLLGVWLLVALVFAFLTPPFFAPDETLHVAWATRYFTGLDPTRGQVCSDLEKPIHAFPFEKVLRKGSGEIKRDLKAYSTANIKNEDCTKIVSAGNYVASYLYWPTQLIFSLGLQWPSALFLIRVFQISFFAALLWFLLKKSELTGTSQRFLIFSFLSFVSLPLTVQQIFAISTDYQILLACVGMVALVFADIMTSAQILVALVFILLGAMAKPTFMPLLLGLGWMAYSLKTPRTRRLVVSGLVVIATLVLVRGLYYMLFGLKNNLSTGAYDMAEAQKAFIIAHPIRTLFVILSSGWTKIFQIPGASLSWLSFKMPYVSLVGVHVPLFVFWLCLYRAKFFRGLCIPQFHSKEFYGFAAHVASMVGFIVVTGLSLYIIWTRPGLDRVMGLQARYYFPLLTYFLILVCRLLPDKPRLQVSSRSTKLILLSLLVSYSALFVKLWQAFPV